MGEGGCTADNIFATSTSPNTSYLEYLNNYLLSRKLYENIFLFIFNINFNF